MDRVLYFDAFNGVAGDMILGGLIDLGMPMCHLQEELGKLDLYGYHLSAEKIERQGLFGINFQVVTEGHSNHSHSSVEQSSSGNHNHSHSHESGHSYEHHHHPHRGFTEIRKLIESSTLDQWVKEKSVQIFRCLAEAEAKVHQSTIEEVHFHEVGAVDSIVDIVGACIGFRYFGIDDFYSSALNLGGGTVTFSHGTWPVPTPATAELVRGFPSRIGTIPFELTTPTGAAIVTTLSKPVSEIPQLSLEDCGYGAGDKAILSIPNMLRLLLGRLDNRSQKSGDDNSAVCHEEDVVLFEATIDDMDGESWGHFLEIAFKEGALDVYFTPVQMKKCRPGVLVSVICDPNDSERIAALIFQETTTLGIRRTTTRRLVLNREIRTVNTEFGEIRFKVGQYKGKDVNICPEFEDVRRVSEETGLPLKIVKQKLMDRLEEKLS